MPPRRAGPDAWVTAHLLLELLRITTVEQMIAWSDQPRPMPTLPFGKHRGATWSEVPADYLQWMVGQDMDPDVLWHVRPELDRLPSEAGPSRSAGDRAGCSPDVSTDAP